MIDWIANEFSHPQSSTNGSHASLVTNCGMCVCSQYGVTWRQCDVTISDTVNQFSTGEWPSTVCNSKKFRPEIPTIELEPPSWGAILDCNMPMRNLWLNLLVEARVGLRKRDVGKTGAVVS